MAENQNHKPPKKQLNDYARFSGIAFQMIATILLGTFGGIELDKFIPNKVHIFTIVLSLASVFLAIYNIVINHVSSVHAVIYITNSTGKYEG